jgi:uncharacterized protein YndB with AHSA1/START domain
VSTPLRMSFEVACSVEHAFDVWTSGIGTWWPRDHTTTGNAELVVLQSGVGGRIYERGPDGEEHDWGEVTVWEPPSQVTYSWHLGRDRADAGEVDIRFWPGGGGTTRVEIEHRGWERTGDTGDAWRERNLAGWRTVTPHFVAAIAKGDQ